jgi:GNAT superfamily N-acetyltransferase
MSWSNFSFKMVPYNSADYHKIVELRSLVLRQPLGLVFSKEELENEHNQIHFGVFENELAIASVLMLPVDQNTVKMRQVSTHPNYQGKGIGKELAAYTEHWTKEKGYKKIECHARKTAVEFYEKMGYKIVGEMFFEVGLEHFKMTKNI